jgi:hypothetical protein
MIIDGSPVDIAPGASSVAHAQCPAGMTAIAGGFSGPSGIAVNVSGNGPLSRWTIAVTNNGSVNATVLAQASCAFVIE